MEDKKVAEAAICCWEGGRYSSVREMEDQAVVGVVEVEVVEVVETKKAFELATAAIIYMVRTNATQTRPVHQVADRKRGRNSDVSTNCK